MDYISYIYLNRDIMKIYRIVSCIFVFLLLTPTLFSQDIILRRNGKSISAEILKADSSQISYYRFTDPEETVYFLSTLYVESITFKDGSIRRYSSEDVSHEIVYNPLKKNVLNISPLDLFFGSIYSRYEKLLGTGRFGLFIGGALNMNPEEFRYYAEDNYSHLSDWGYSIVRSRAYIETGLFVYSPNLGPFSFGSGTSFILGYYKVLENEGYGDDNPEPGNKLAFKWMWINKLRIDLSDTWQLYIEGGLSITPHFFNNSIVHLGFSISF